MDFCDLSRPFVPDFFSDFGRFQGFQGLSLPSTIHIKVVILFDKGIVSMYLLYMLCTHLYVYIYLNTHTYLRVNILACLYLLEKGCFRKKGLLQN